MTTVIHVTARNTPDMLFCATIGEPVRGILLYFTDNSRGLIKLTRKLTKLFLFGQMQNRRARENGMVYRSDDRLYTSTILLGFTQAHPEST